MARWNHASKTGERDRVFDAALAKTGRELFEWLAPIEVGIDPNPLRFSQGQLIEVCDVIGMRGGRNGDLREDQETTENPGNARSGFDHPRGRESGRYSEQRVDWKDVPDSN